MLIRFYFRSLLLKPQYWLIVFITYITKVPWHLHYSPSKSGFYTHYKVDLSDTFLRPNFCVCSLFAFLGGAGLQPNPRRTSVTSDRLGPFRSSWRSADRRASGPELHGFLRKITPIDTDHAFPGSPSVLCDLGSGDLDEDERQTAFYRLHTEIPDIRSVGMMSLLERARVLMASVGFHLGRGKAVICNRVVPAEVRRGTLGISSDERVDLCPLNPCMEKSCE